MLFRPLYYHLFCSSAQSEQKMSPRELGDEKFSRFYPKPNESETLGVRPRKVSFNNPLGTKLPGISEKVLRPQPQHLYDRVNPHVSLQKLGKARKQILPYSLQKEPVLLTL